MMLLALGAARNAVASPNPEDVFGIAHVDGKYFLTREDFLDEGADQVLATGSKVLKIYLAPKRYPWKSDWPKGMKSMVQLAQQQSGRGDSSLYRRESVNPGNFGNHFEVE